MMSEAMLPELSRRRFITGAAVAAFVHGPLANALSIGTRGSKTFAYVGTYTGNVGGGSNGEGIYRFEMDSATGELSQRKLVAKSPDPSWIAIHPSKKYLYVVNEVSDYQGNSGSVSAFAIDQTNGDLTALNVVSSEGAGPCYLSIDASGRHAFVANYGGGSVAALPIDDHGLIGKAVSIHQDSGHLGSTQATDAPTGSYAVSGHDAPHAHMILPDPHGRFVLATDLGQDRIYTYAIDATTGEVTFGDGVTGTELPTGDGPRHLAFHPNGHWLYSIQEESSTIALFDYDPARGALSLRQTISALPSGFTGTSFASEILMGPGGKFLYAANRLHDTIATLAIGHDGRLTWVGETPTLGDYPGQCRIDPSGSFLYACNRRSDSITCFRIHRDTGLLKFTGQYTAVGSPASITFLDA
jgi:6-phosphogluconolactonase (cycloisomerase 2 family)